jgi:processive 1,2-diacylglycerol beta-glucosyltransferase
MDRIAIVSAGIGAGHDGAAKELARRLRDRGFEVDRLDFLDVLPGRLGRALCAGYHRQLETLPRSWDWLLLVLGWQPVTRLIAALLSMLAGRELTRSLNPRIGLIVSTYPLAGHALARLKRRGALASRLVVYLTDPSVHRLCVVPGADLHIAPHALAAQRCRQLRAGEVSVARPAVAPEFRPAVSASERARVRRAFGLPPDEHLALIVSGSWGVGEVEQTVRDVAESGAVVPVVVCGKNQQLHDQLAGAGFEHVFGWVEDMPELIRACDLVVQNAGGLTTSEALASGVPVVTYRCLPGHGRANARVLDEAGLAPWVRRPSDLASTLAGMAAGNTGRVDYEGPDPAQLVAALADEPQVVRAVAPRRSPRRRVAIAAAVVASLLWTGTGGTSMAVANGLREVNTDRHRPEVILLVNLAPERVLSADDIRALRELPAAVAVSEQAARQQPNSVKALAQAGVLVVSAAGGTPYETGIINGRRAIAGASAAIRAATGRNPQLLVSNGSLDAIDLGQLSWYRERVVIPQRMVHCGQDLSASQLEGLVMVEDTSPARCDPVSTTERLRALAVQASVRTTPLAELVG